MATKPSQEDEVSKYVVDEFFKFDEMRLSWKDEIIRKVIKIVMLRYDLFDTCEDMPRDEKRLQKERERKKVYDPYDILP